MKTDHIAGCILPGNHPSFSSVLTARGSHGPWFSPSRYAPKDAKKGGLVAKGAAPSRDLVRIGIENVLKEVLGPLAAIRSGE